MSQNTIVLPTIGLYSGLQIAQLINQALDTLNTLWSGASAPAGPSTYQLWQDTTTGYLRQYNGSSWLIFGTTPYSATTPTSPATGQLWTDTNTSPGVVKRWNGSAWRPLGIMPVGAVTDFAGSTTPTGWLLCAGQAVSRTTYADLFTEIGTTYGVGDGSTTFNLPDYRGRVGVGKDNMNGSAANRITNAICGIVGTTLGATGGSESMTAHTHTGGSHLHDLGSHQHDMQNHVHGAGLYVDNSNTTGIASGTTTPNTQGGIQGGGATNVGANSAAALSITRSAQAGIGGTSGLGNTNTTSAATGNTGLAGVVATTSTGAGASQNVQPSIIVNKIIFAGV